MIILLFHPLQLYDFDFELSIKHIKIWCLFDLKRGSTDAFGEMGVETKIYLQAQMS